MVEVAVSQLCEATYTVKPVYSAVIHYPDIDRFKDAWVFGHTDLTVDDVKGSMKTIGDVAFDLRRILHGREVTAYNVPFDFGKFLYREPWDLEGEFTVPYDIMDKATNLVWHLASEDLIEDKKIQCRLLQDWEDFPGKWVRAIDSYKVLCPDDPVGLDGIQTHRAQTDTIQEAYILRACLTYGEKE